MKNGQITLRFSVVCLLLTLGIIAVWFAPTLLGSEMDKSPAPLTRDLATLPKDLGTNPRFMALGLDDRMEPDVVEALGTNLYLLRDYTRVNGVDAEPTTDVISLNINYYAKGTATPHVPDICWLGNGLSVVYDKEIWVKNVPHKDGTMSDIPMHLLSFQPQTSDNQSILQLSPKVDHDKLLTVAYTFQVNGQYVGNREQVAKLFWRRGSKYCYHCKIEIKYKRLCSPETAQPVIEAFLRASLPQIEECLPDWQKLNAPPAAAKASSVVSASH